MTDISSAAHGVALRTSSLRLFTILLMAVFSGVVTHQGAPGSIIALVPLAMLVLLCWTLHWKAASTLARLLVLFAALGTVAVAIDPGTLNLTVVWLSLSALALAGRNDPLRNFVYSILRLAIEALLSPLKWSQAALRASVKRKASGNNLLDWRMFFLPLISLLVFSLLFALSNPVFEDMIGEIISFRPSLATLRAIAIAFLVLCVLWSVEAMLPAPQAIPLDLQSPAPAWHTSLFSPAPVLATLAVLNGLFLLQNALDAQYIWSGMPMQPGSSYAEYAQRGAATLIVTILLAAFFVILALWPGSRTSQSSAVRLLLYVWIAQNGFLLASCAARLFSYVDAYGMTMWRLSSLVWMGLVGCGLLLVAFRVLANRSNLWLINANTAAAFVILWGSGFVDYKSIVADYNAGWSIGGRPYDDLAYLYELGPSALPALERLTGKSLNHLDYEANHIRNQLGLRQSDWRSWTLRGHWIQRRLLPEFADLSERGKSAIVVQPCQSPDRKMGSSNPWPNLSGTSSQDGGCPAPSLPPGRE